ncbi:aspartate carbamoyltransferase regulatory subunit [Hypnocyclicus thermotrophus]|uniref:Aspartate carbamoyltransferase regulatory chain n=1 Tax=Hypnocyclicus thermotrophus TaxID=1627895 RepID=A0AA46DX27_9FUSO|nr:aspartate carbamoyltransferase regulatory subunit [Hypnocyclicus thermotrophus]TDT67404.1 aspartate carbamoyltransferase regulatory subunit [Hypnocyclicus thermotrophus]
MELQITAIENGTVIDHIPSEKTLKIMEILSLSEYDDTITLAFNLPSKSLKKKGLIKIANKYLTEKEIEKITLIAHNITVNIIENFKVKEKLIPSLPKTIEDILVCTNPKCITNNENVKSKFYIDEKENTARCNYCEREKEIEKLSIK